LASEAFVFTAANREAREHRERTIDSPVAVAEVRLHAARAADAMEERGLDEARCWGALPTMGNLRSWQRMRPGHWGLLYAGEKRFPLMLRVGLKARYRGLARHLWGEDPEGLTWELMYFFDQVRQVDLGLAEVREIFGYDRKWRPQGLQYPGAEQQSALLEKYGAAAALASAASGQSPATGPAAVSVDDLLDGGRFRGVPKRPPRSPQRRLPPDPDRSGRGYIAHEKTVAALEKHVGRAYFSIGTLGVNHDGYWKANGDRHICEVKSITARNEVGQLQKGLGQVLHNRFKTEWNGAKAVHAYLIAEREPSNSQLWRALASQQEVVFTWPGRFAEDVPTP
jgi:hypothetical protein